MGASVGGNCMKHLAFRIALVMLVLGQCKPAARAADQSAPAASNVPGAPTPSVAPDRSITFTLQAPDARAVQVAGGDGLGAGPFPMTKNAEGTWQVTPTIDASYRTLSDREHRAMAGLSMGGMETLFVALHHLDTFAFIASLSGPSVPNLNSNQSLGSVRPSDFDSKTAYEAAFANPAEFNRRVKLLWLGVGTAEPELFRAGIGTAAKALEAAGVRLTYFESQGTAHEWQTWRRDLNDLAPRLFR